MYLHSLFVSVATARLCLAELKENVISNRQLTELKKAVEQFTIYQKHVLPKEVAVELQDKNFDNVALLVELFPIIAALPPDKTEWFMSKVEGIIAELAAEVQAQAQAETHEETESLTNKTEDNGL